MPPGIYVLQLEADDAFRSSVDSLIVNVATVCTVDAPEGIVAWWPFETDAEDIIGANDGAFLSEIGFVAGKAGVAPDFDGITDGVTVPADPSLDVGSGEGFTIEFWMRSDELKNTTLIEWNNGSSAGVNLTTESFQSRLTVNLVDSGGSSHAFFVQNFYLVGETVHGALSYDKNSGEAILYQNGEIVATESVGSFTPQTGYDLHFGHSPTQAASYNEFLDEISLYSRVLTSDEVFSIFATDNVGKCLPDGNSRPFVDAGPDQSASDLSETVFLNGFVTDDGLPEGFGIESEWTQVDGPGTATFADPAAAVTTVTFDAAGIYLLQLQADDGFKSASDTMEARVGVLCSLEAPEGLVGWWPGNGDGRDLSRLDGGNDAELRSGVAFLPAQVSFGFGFDGANDAVRVPANPDIDVGQGGGFAIEFWMQSDVVRNAPVIEWGDSGSVGVNLRTETFQSRLTVDIRDNAGGGHTFLGSSTFSVVHCGGDVEFTDGEVEHGD